MTTGVTPQGFIRPTMAEVLADLENANVDVFGTGLIQTSQTPMGQWNGLRADLIMAAWETAQGTYQTYDVNQAVGERLDQLARIRLLQRKAGERDEDFAQAIHNRGVAQVREADFDRAVAAVDGVSWHRIFVNDKDATNAQGIPSHSIAVAALGGDDGDIAQVARKHIVPGIGSYGNQTVETLVGGFCRAIDITRPVEIFGKLRLNIRRMNDDQGCPPPSNLTVQQTLFSHFQSAGRPANGSPLTLHGIRQALCNFTTIEVVGADYARGNADQVDLVPLPHAFTFFEIAAFNLQDITVDVV